MLENLSHVWSRLVQHLPQGGWRYCLGVGDSRRQVGGRVGGCSGSGEAVEGVHRRVGGVPRLG